MRKRSKGEWEKRNLEAVGVEIVLYSNSHASSMSGGRRANIRMWRLVEMISHAV